MRKQSAEKIQNCYILEAILQRTHADTLGICWQYFVIVLLTFGAAIAKGVCDENRCLFFSQVQ